MKTSEVLRRVREHLRDGGYMRSHERYICYAIEALYFIDKTIGVSQHRTHQHTTLQEAHHGHPQGVA